MVDDDGVVILADVDVPVAGVSLGGSTSRNTPGRRWPTPANSWSTPAPGPAVALAAPPPSTDLHPKMLAVTGAAIDINPPSKGHVHHHD